MSNERTILGIPQPIDINRESSNSLTINQLKKNILINIEKIISRHTLEDKEWIKAISSQYFLVELAKVFGLTDHNDYKNVLEESLSSFKLRFDGGYRIDEKNILIIPEENQKLLQCMIREDETSNYYTKTNRLAAQSIKYPEIIYRNYHYGLMIKICAAENTENLRVIQNISLQELFKQEALDEYGGWYHYRLPWITARILISLKSVDLHLNPRKHEIQKQIDGAIESLIKRLYDDKYWKSGAGEWVSSWESTALCLEALMEYNVIKKHIVHINNVVKYLLSKECLNKWLNKEVGMDTEESANECLASVALASILYRVIKKYYKKTHQQYVQFFIDYFNFVIKLLLKNDQPAKRQYCTIPQILYYISIALKS